MACKIKDKKSRLNIVLVGKTGSGKSATGNCILDREVFESSDSTTSCTATCRLESVKHGDIVINIIDTPGIMDTSKPPEEIMNKIEEAMSLCQGGFNAFILVLRPDIRFTKEEHDTFKIIKSFFGPEFLNVCIIVFTRGDVFEISNDDTKPFDKWLEEQEGDLKDVLQECHSRAVLFYNSVHKLFIDKRQIAVRKLLKMINDNDMIYTDENFKKAEDGRKKLTLEMKMPQLQAKYQEQLSLLQAEYEKASKNLTDESVELIMKQAQKILDSINADADGTEVLNGFEYSVIKQIDQLKTLQHSKNKAKKLQKIAEYNNMLKNAPSRAWIPLKLFGAVYLGALGAVYGVATIASELLNLPKPIKGAISQTAKNLGQASFILVEDSIDLIKEKMKLNKKLKSLEKELEEID